MSREAAPPCQLRREYVLNPITALAFLTVGEEQYLLAAEDTDIKIYHVATSQPLGTIPIFDGQPIHGIYVPPVTDTDDGKPSVQRSAPQVLVWGANAVKVLPGRVVEQLISVSSNDGVPDDVRVQSRFLSSIFEAPEAVAPDWIFDGRISPFDDYHIVLLTAHNEVIQGRVSADQRTLVLGRIQSPCRPNLYSGNLFWVERNSLLVAAGTVFGEIVVWKCHLGSNAGIKRDNDDIDIVQEAGCEVLFVFSGHEGSIFGVHISSEIFTSTGEAIRLLSSCSDDRTIRIWDITERKEHSNNENNTYDTQISESRQTGFGDSIIGSVGLANSPSRCIAMAMGHLSRIWQVEINSLNPGFKGDMFEVYSFGEDGTMQRWHLELNVGPQVTAEMSEIGASTAFVPPQSKMTHHETFSNHSGKQIWSHAMLANTNGVLIATGGGDGKIALLESDSIHTPRAPADAVDNIDQYPRRIQELDVSPTYLIEQCEDESLGPHSSTTSYIHGNGKEMFQSFTFITDIKLLLTTRSGRLFLGTLTGKTEWKELRIPDVVRKTIQSYTILRSSRRTATAFIGAPNGKLFYYHEASGDSLVSIHKAERKIVDIICLSDTLVPSSSACCNSERRESHEFIEILVLAYGCSRAELLRLDQTRTLVQRSEVEIPDGLIVTTAAWCHGYLVLGSRDGNLTFFSPALENKYTPLLTVEVNTGDKVASILQLPRHSENSPRYLLTTARDGKYRIYEILNATGNLQIRLLHETSPPFGPLIAESWLFDREDGKQDLMLSGFRSKYFVIWNVTEQSEVATIECGGGHRVWDQVQILGNPNGFRFVCTKASQMKIFSQTRPPHLSLKKGGHGREIKAVAVASGKYMATGAEDTAIRIWEIGKRGQSEQQFRSALILEKHNTGIQKLKWYKDQYLFSSGGNEEFYIWRVSALESDICPLGVVCEAVFTDRSEIGDLRITDFEVHRLNDETVGNRVATSEMPSPQPEFCITMTLSNSTVQSYLYSPQSGFRLLGRRMYTGACLTQLRHLNFIDRCYPQVLAAATDGHLAVFPHIHDSDGEVEDSSDTLVTKLHQSTIKSLDMHSIATTAGTSYLVVTGGDDDAIGVLHIYSPRADSPTLGSSQQHPQYEIRNKIIVRSTHAAAITGIGIVRLENDERDAVISTASNDQRVKLWRLVDWQSASMKFQLIDDRYSGVADAGDLEVLREVGGKGGESRGIGNGERVVVAGVGIEAWDIS
ncbi:WD40-repeat-containing domain protein [Xylaria bambusicola]|uniref:WD40-repeat-containing domain protein n=1 Tax=Xylaria bambusicola TaxID=326684 RepID=UPI00200876F6|nr:WD40-repeat-containing domain protein [Xylaria bambusicola]KAI0521545.1 WD40-repeat-containing domain protein [Xylaria bambusicola]